MTVILQHYRDRMVVGCAYTYTFIINVYDH